MPTNSLLDTYVLLRKSIATQWASRTKTLGFGHNQIRVLYRLILSEATMGELVDYTLSDKASMTRTITALVKQGLVRRKADLKDRRIIRIELTKKGKEIAQDAKKIRLGIERSIEAALSSEERAEFIKLTGKIISQLQE